MSEPSASNRPIRMRSYWLLFLVAFFPGLLFGAYMNGGAFSYVYPPGLVLAAAPLLFLSAICFSRSVRDGLTLNPTTGIAGALYAVVLVVCVYQLLVQPGVDKDRALYALIRLLGLAAAFSSAALVSRSACRVWPPVTTVLPFLALGLMFNLIELSGYVVSSMSAAGDAGGRLVGRFGSANATALLAAVSGAMGLHTLQSISRTAPGSTPTARRSISVKGAGQWLAYLAIGSSVVLLLLTRSRLTMLAVAVALLATQIVYPGAWAKGRLYRILLPAGVAAALLVLLLLLTLPAGRLGSLSADAEVRRSIYAAHLPYALDHPLAGYGFGSFVDLNRAATTAQNYKWLYSIGALHSVYLQWMEQAGWIATGAICLCVLTLLVVRKPRPGGNMWRKIALSTTVLFGVCGLFDVQLEYASLSTLFAVVLGMANGLVGASDRKGDLHQIYRSPS